MYKLYRYLFCDLPGQTYSYMITNKSAHQTITV